MTPLVEISSDLQISKQVLYVGNLFLRFMRLEKKKKKKRVNNKDYLFETVQKFIYDATLITIS